MRILIDKQVFIWFVENDKQLPFKIKIDLEDLDNTIIVSIASFWEMTIKVFDEYGIKRLWKPS